MIVVAPREIPVRGSDRPALVDEDDYPLLARHTWFFGNQGYPTSNVPRPGCLMHRFIMPGSNRNGGLSIDHVNRDKLDNRKANLRLVRFAINVFNVGKRPHSKQPYKGVRRTAVGTWAARIGFQGKTHHLGCFRTPEEAAAAYEAAAHQFYGEGSRA
jgi:sugar (pentulose or hexulose) kinase